MASPKRSGPAPQSAAPGTGFEEALRYPLFSAITNRRSRRISKGLSNLAAGSLSYSSSSLPHPLTAEEEALLVAATGITGVTMPDMPFQAPDGSKLLGSPMVEVYGRAASSPDNAQATHFFLINDTGTYFLKRVGSSRVDLQACKLEYSIVSPK